MRSGTGKFSAPWRHAANVLLVLGVAALAACGKEKEAPPQPRPVVSMTVHPDGGGVSPVYPGDIEARNATPLSFRVNGKIIERSVRLGDNVKPGQTLARLDPADFEKNAASAQAQFDAAQHRLVFAKQQLDRDTAQSAANLIARAQLEQTQDAYASAAAQRDQAQQQLALAKNQLRYTQVVADHAGVITAENADTGQNVQAGQAVYQLAWSGDVDVVCDLPERLDTARLRELAAAADPQSRTWRARLTLERPDADVRLGMTANVAFAAPSEANAPAAFTVPATALFHDGAAPAIWVVHAPDNVLQLRRVNIARYDARTITVAGGLQDGERIVLQGVHTVHAGEQVRPVAPLHPEDFAS
ncbi:efflux RND transporter periplasmic adaptor subunit [Paraburkholderia sp. BR14262]|uniref:efflux RND transporter periplasmic adaptor subunit n=1 Tax=Paraburkholderia sp. BR14262 TaxID=3236999 RepID=UPI0034CF2944